jgi:transcription initiation factor TFIID TATA-box-binding protein
MVREDENTKNERIKDQVTSWYAQTVDKMKACQGTQSSCLHEMRRRAAEGGAAALDSITSEIDAYNAQCVAGAAAVEEHALVMVHNVVGTAKVVCSSLPFDLQLIHSILPNSTFKKKKFAAITIRLFDPHCTVLLFASGKMVLTGCRDFLLCVLATHKVIAVLRQAIPCADFECSSIQMQNIVGHVDMQLERASVDLELFYKEYNIECTFQKSMFPGLVYRAQDSAVVMLIFASGRVVITGGRCLHSINAAWEALRAKLVKFVKEEGAEAVVHKKRRGA